MTVRKPRHTTAVLALALLLVVLLAVTHAAPQTSSQVAYLKGQSALVPLRAIFEWLGAEVEFSKGSIVAARGDTKVRLKTGSRTAWIGDKETKLAVAPTLIGGKTYVPLRFVAESFGVEVGYDAKAHKVTVAQGGKVLVMAVGETPSGARGDRIAFVRGGNVWVVKPDGTGSQRLTTSGKCRHPNWSPDGQFLVFESSGNIVRMRVSDLSIKALTKGGGCCQPAWRPGTDQVWYGKVTTGADPSGPPDMVMWRVPAQGGKARRCFNAGWGVEPDRAVWGPDGARIAVSLVAPEGSDVVEFTAEGRPGKTPPALEGCNYLARSPRDPGLVAFTSTQWDIDFANVESSALSLFDTDTQRCTALWHAPTGTEVLWPTWSPDGRSLAYSSGGRIWTVDLHSRKATALSGDGSQPAWSPR